MQNTSLLAMLKLSSIEKLKINFVEEEDGSGTIYIEWDETDPDLQWWTELGPENQKTFMIDSLYAALECHVD